MANKWLSDLSFYLPKEDLTVPAHSLILVAASPVLERCCYSSKGVRNGNTTITVPSYCSSRTFQIVLQYMYMGINGHSLLNSLLPISDVASVLKIAEFYELNALVEICVTKIASSLNRKDVCSVFDQTHCLDIELNRTLLLYMREFAKDIIANGTAMLMSDEALGKFLTLDELRIADESILVGPMISWADAECKARSIEANPKNRRLVLDTRLHYIRFATMPFEQFLVSCSSFGDNFFTENEFSLIVKQICYKTVTTSRFLSFRRLQPADYRKAELIIEPVDEYTYRPLIVHKATVKIVSYHNVPFILRGLTLLNIDADDCSFTNSVTSRNIAIYTSKECLSTVWFRDGIVSSGSCNTIAFQIFSTTHFHLNVRNKPVKVDSELTMYNDYSCLSSVFYNVYDEDLFKFTIL